MIITENEIVALAARLSAHATSVLASDQPETRADMKLAARLLLRMVIDGTVYGYVRLDPDDEGKS